MIGVFFPTLMNIWLVLGALGAYQLYLQLTARGKKPYREGFIKVFQYLGGIPALGTLLVFLIDPDELSFVFVHLSSPVHFAGVTLFNLSALIILWAHLTLGKFWSGDLETLPEHTLIDSGPYRFARHPLYSSYLLLTLGFFLATGNWFVGALMLVYFMTVAARAWKEEEMLLACLGETYAAYQDKVPRFFPFIPNR